MTRTAAFFVVLGAVCSACDVDCGPPNQVNGTYAVFANVLLYDGTNLEEFPSYGSPANGWREWTLEWPNAYAADVGVSIDGYDYAARGDWDPLVCGNFTLAFQGEYVPWQGSSHYFDANGEFTVFGLQLEGRWDYAEDWVTSNGFESGTFTADGQVSGSLIDDTGY